MMLNGVSPKYREYADIHSWVIRLLLYNYMVCCNKRAVASFLKSVADTDAMVGVLFQPRRSSVVVIVKSFVPVAHNVLYHMM